MSKINVLIVDDMQILRNGLKVILESSDSINVAGMMSNGKHAYEYCANHPIDVVLMDMRMPDYDGSFGTNLIKREFPHIKVLVLTTFDDSETISRAIESGADGYILKEMSDEMIIHSIISVYNGVNVFCNNVYKNMSSHINYSPLPDNSKKEADFTDRELELIHYIAQGYDNKEISKLMYLAEGTVRNNISRLLTKLKLKDRTQLAIYAVKNGID